MHYANGREAKNGDRVVLVTAWGGPITGILYNAQAGNDYCNGSLAIPHSGDPCPNLKECLHVDDFKALVGTDLSQVPDTSAPPASAQEGGN